MLLTAWIPLATASLSEPAAAATKPNIVVIQTDDQRWDTLQYMPAVRARLMGSGVTFTNAFVTTGLCCPSRASFLTGKYTHNHGVWWNIPPEGGAHVFHANGAENQTLAVWLKNAGYATSLIGKYLNGYGLTGLPPYVPPGWDDWHALIGLERYYDYALYENGVSTPYGAQPADYSTDALRRKAVQFIKRTDGPFFLYFAPIAPHLLAVPANRHQGTCDDLALTNPPSFNEADVSDKPRWVRELPPLGPFKLEGLARNRRESICTLKAVDEAVNAILDALGPKLANTVVVFTSDNGLAWGEHRFDQKSCVYDECNRVPLVVRPPGGTTARTIKHYVLNLDLTATITSLAGLGVPAGIDGRSLVPLLQGGDTPLRRSFLIEHLNLTARLSPAKTVQYDAALRSGRFLYAHLGTGEKELYDLANDPYQLVNVAASADPEGLARLETRLRELRSCARAACHVAEAAELGPVNLAPIPRITAPAANATFRVGATITLRGSATDPETGPLPAAALSWEVVLRHRTQPFRVVGPQQGNDLTFVAPGPKSLEAAADSHLEVRLTATDATGLRRTITQVLRPRLVELRVATEPSGIGLTVGGQAVTPPATVRAWVGQRIWLAAPSEASHGGTTVTWASWSDGGARVHAVTAPATATTYTARFRPA